MLLELPYSSEKITVDLTFFARCSLSFAATFVIDIPPGRPMFSLPLRMYLTEACMQCLARVMLVSQLVESRVEYFFTSPSCVSWRN